MPGARLIFDQVYYAKPDEHVYSRFEKLFQLYIHHFLLGPEDQDLFLYFSQQSLPENTRITQTHSTKELLSEIKHCHLFIGNDSGPAHVANLYGKKMIILWGPGNDKKTAPSAKTWSS